MERPLQSMERFPMTSMGSGSGMQCTHPHELHNTKSYTCHWSGSEHVSSWISSNVVLGENPTCGTWRIWGDLQSWLRVAGSVPGGLGLQPIHIFRDETNAHSTRVKNTSFPLLLFLPPCHLMECFSVFILTSGSSDPFLLCVFARRNNPVLSYMVS